MKFIDNEKNIVFETESHYVYRIKFGIYEVREHKFTHSIVIGKFENEDEDEDTKQRAIEFCSQISK